MNRMRVAPRLLAGLAIAVAALSAAPAGAQERRSLTIGLSQFPSTFHPAIENMVAKQYILAMTNRRLMGFDPKWAPVCFLCETYPTLENGLIREEALQGGGTGQAVTIRIRDGLRWADGTPVTAKDLEFSWRVGRSGTNGYFDTRPYRGIDRVEVVDDRTAVFHRDRARCDLFDLNEFFVLPAHLEEPVFTANPDEYRTRTAFDADPTNPGLWFGPYRITKVERGSYVQLERNPHWPGDRPWFDRITVRSIENTAALEAAALSGDVDMIPGELGNLSVDQLMNLERRGRGRLAVSYKPSLVYEHVDLKLDHPILSDARVRRALLLSLDRKTLLERVFSGRYPIAHQQISPLDPMHSAVTEHPFDPAQAARLLDEAGWRPGPDGTRRNGAGEPLSLVFQTTAGNRIRELVQQAMQAQWKSVGVDVQIRNEPARVLFGQTLKERTYPGMVLYAWTQAPQNVPRTFFHSTEIPRTENGFAGQNFFGWSNPAVDDALDRLETTCAAPERAELWATIQRAYAEDLPALPIYYRADGFVLPLWLAGVEPTGHQYASTHWIEQWRAR